MDFRPDKSDKSGSHKYTHAALTVAGGSSRRCQVRLQAPGKIDLWRLHRSLIPDSWGYRKLLAQIWRTEIGPRIFDEIRYSELAKIANSYQWSKKTYNNAINVIRCAFDYGYKDHPEKHNPASGLKRLRITKKDRPVVAAFTIQDAELLISRLHADWGGAIGSYDEFRFFTGLRPSEQIALLVTDYDARRGVLSVTKARVLRRDKDPHQDTGGSGG